MSWEQMESHLDQMRSYIRLRDWGHMEQHFHAVCYDLAGPRWAHRIASVDLVGYREALCQGLSQSLTRAQVLSARAVYFEYDLDNDWQGSFFIHATYRREISRGDERWAPDWDDWACDWLESIDGPSCPELVSIYQETSGFDKTDLDQGVTLYLVARTIAAFGHASTTLAPGDIAICLAYHDGDIMRIHEAS